MTNLLEGTIEIPGYGITTRQGYGRCVWLLGMAVFSRMSLVPSTVQVHKCLGRRPKSQ